MPTTYDSDSLVAAVRREALLPDASDITAADILAIADEEMVTTLAELTKSSQQAYWMTYEDIAMSASVLRYRYPRRALGRTIRGVTFLDSAGYEHPLAEMDAEQGQTFGYAGQYYVEGDEIVFFRNIPPQAVTLRWRYMRRPSKLIPVASGARIQKPASSTVLELSSSQPSAALATGMYVDIVRGDAPYDLSYLDRLVVGYVASTSVTFDASTPVDTADFVSLTAVTNGRADYVCPRDQTVYPPIPNEGWPLLVSRVARVVLEASRDAQGAAMADATSAKRDAALRAIIQPRNESGNRTLMNPRGAMRGGGGGYGGRRWR